MILKPGLLQVQEKNGSISEDKLQEDGGLTQDMGRVLSEFHTALTLKSFGGPQP